MSPRLRSSPRSCSPWPARPSRTAYDQPGTAVFADTLSFAVAIAVIAVVGAIVTLAVPGNRVGWLLLAAAAVLGVGTAFTEAGIHGVVTVPGLGARRRVPGRPRPGPAGGRAGDRRGGRAGRVSRRAPARAAVALAGLVGRRRGGLPVPRQRAEPYHKREPAGASWRSPLGLPVRYGNVAGALSAAGVLLAVAAAAGAIAGLVTRWRRGGPLVRQQLLLLALATGPPALVFLADTDHQRPSRLDLRRGAAAAAGRDRDRDPPPRPV